MKSLEIMSINLDRTYEIIKHNLYSCKTISRLVNDTKFHHQTRIEKVPLTLKNGIVSKKRLAELEGRKLTDMEINSYSDFSYVNGISSVSLSSMEVDFSMMGDDELYWNPFFSIGADIIVSKNVPALKVTTNYFNEFLVEDRIEPKNFNAIDLRILKIYNHKFSDKHENRIDSKVRRMIKHYNILKDIAYSLKENDLNIPLREVSNENEIITLDPEKIMRLPNLILKNYKYENYKDI